MRSPPLLQVIVMQNGDYGCVHDEDMLSDEHWRHYNLVMVMLQYVLPLTAVTFTYGHMAKVRENVQSQNLPFKDSSGAILTFGGPFHSGF